MELAKEIENIKDPAILRICKHLMSRTDVNVNKHPGKSIKEMYTYIRMQAQKKAFENCACIEEDEVYGWAVHYFDEKEMENFNSGYHAPITPKKSEQTILKKKAETQAEEVVQIIEKPVAAKVKVSKKDKKENCNEEQLQLF